MGLVVVVVVVGFAACPTPGRVPAREGWWCPGFGVLDYAGIRG